MLYRMLEHLLGTVRKPRLCLVVCIISSSIVLEFGKNLMRNAIKYLSKVNESYNPVHMIYFLLVLAIVLHRRDLLGSPPGYYYCLNGMLYNS